VLSNNAIEAHIPKTGQHREHRDEGNAILQHGAKLLDEHHGAAAGFIASAVEMVVEIGRFVKARSAEIDFL